MTHEETKRYLDRKIRQEKFWDRRANYLSNLDNKQYCCGILPDLNKDKEISVPKFSGFERSGAIWS